MRSSPYLRGLPPAELRLLTNAAERRVLPPGTRLDTDDGAPYLYLVLSGEVGAWTPEDPDGVSELIGQEGPGAMFGSARITGEEDVPVYRTATSVQVCAWRKAELERVLADADELARRLTTRLSRRRREHELVALLRRTSLFTHVGQSLIRWLVRSSTLDSFDPGTAICREGDEGDAMFLIISGEIAITRELEVAQDAGSRAIARLHRGDFFGELALVQDSVRSASAIAMSDAELLVVDKATVAVLDERSSAFRHAVRLTAQRRLEINLAGPTRDPELVWLVNNDARCSTEQIAGLVAQALAEDGARVAPSRRLQSAATLRSALARARTDDAAYVLCHSDGPVGERLAQQVAAAAGSVVVIDGDAPLSHLKAAFHRVHHVVVTAPDASGPQPVRRDTIVVRARPTDLRRSRLEQLPGSTRSGLRRLARAVTRRRVGLALGGGAAWGYAHVALIRALSDAQIPIDLVVGVSVGAVVGAFYASQGLAGLDRLVDANVELTGAALGAVASTQAVSLFIRRHIPEARIEDLALPFATVAVDARTAREKVFRHGSVPAAVRASCSLPGVFAPSILGGRRYLDGAVRHNVPASLCIDAGADFVIASDVVPLPGVAHPRRRGGLTGFALELTQVNRLSDAVRSLYWLTSDSGQRQASVADAVFSPDLDEYEPWDFPRARAIVERSEEQLEDWLPATVARYRTLEQAGRAE